MFRILLAALLLMAAPPTAAVAQQRSGVISGTVIDADTRQPLPGAHVQITELDRGTVTDTEGTFRLDDVPVGVHALRCSYIGFRTRTLTDVVVRSNRTSTVDVRLQAAAVEGDEVTVSAGYFQRHETQPVSHATMNREEIRRSPGAAQELSRVLASVPGVATTGETTQDLMVRGGSPRENATYINNIFVPSISHFEAQDASAYGPIGLINTDLVEQLDFYTGGYSAAYGNRMSSVADIRYRRGNRDRWLREIDLNMSGFGGALEGPIGSNGTLLVAGSRSYLDLIAGALDLFGAPRFGDVQAKADFDLDADNQLTAFQLFGASGTRWDREQSRDDGLISYWDLDNRVNTTGLNWRRFWNERTFSNTALSYSFLAQDITTRYTDTDAVELIFDNRHDYLSFRNVTYWRASDVHRFEFGSDVIYTSGDYRYYLAPFVNEANVERTEVNRNLQIDTWNAEWFGSYILKPTDRLTLTLGSRVGYNQINAAWTLSPRLSTGLELTNRLTLKASGGLYRQELPLIIRSQQDAFRELRDPYVRQIVAGFDYLLGPATKLTLEAYDKQYRQMPIQPPDYDAGPPTYVFDDAGRFFDALQDDGEAWARGLDLMIHRKMADGLYGSLSGSLFRTRYRDYKGDWQNRDFDVRYLITAIGGYRPTDTWEVSIRWTYLGSRPYTPVDVDASARQNRTILDLSRYNRETMPPFHSLYLRSDRRFFLNRITLTTFIEVWNAYNRRNVEDYYWNLNEGRISTNEQFSLLPVGGILLEF